MGQGSSDVRDMCGGLLHGERGQVCGMYHGGMRDRLLQGAVREQPGCGVRGVHHEAAAFRVLDIGSAVGL